MKINILYIISYILYVRGWSGGAMMLGKLPVPGRPTNLDKSRARAYCACSRCGWGCLDIFSLIYLFSFLSPSLCETARYRLKYCLEGPLSPKQPTNPLIRYIRMLDIRYLIHHIRYLDKYTRYLISFIRYLI